MARKYRPNVAALIVRYRKGSLKVLMGKRHDFPDCWQWPQGGVDPGEDLETALRREVREETGLTQLQIIHTFPFPIRYRFPRSRKRKWRKYLGQEQHYFILSIKESDPELKNIKKVKNHEFRKLNWKSPKKAVETAPRFKKKAYKKAYRLLNSFFQTLIHREEI